MSKRFELVAFSILLASFAAAAETVVSSDASDFYARVLSAPKFDEGSLSQKAKAEAEAARLQQLDAAPDVEHAMDYWTPQEMEAEFNLAPEALSAPLSEKDIMEVYGHYGSNVVSIDVNISSGVQRLTVSSPEGTHSARISSARSGYHTVTGCYRPTSLQTMHYSKKYHNSPMPHSIFFRGGFAIHGTLAEGMLGRPASHGCVRVSRANAAYLFNLVRTYGAQNTIICVHY